MGGRVFTSMDRMDRIFGCVGMGLPRGSTGSDDPSTGSGCAEGGHCGLSPSPQPSPIEGEGGFSTGSGCAGGRVLTSMDRMDRILSGWGWGCHVVRQAHHDPSTGSGCAEGGHCGLSPSPQPSPIKGEGAFDRLRMSGGRVFTWINRMNGMDRIFWCGGWPVVQSLTKRLTLPPGYGSCHLAGH